MPTRLEQSRFWSWAEGAASVGSLIAAARRLRNVSQTDLAASLGVSNANISRIERGADLRVSTLVELARALRFEPVLIPKEHIGAVRALLETLGTQAASVEPQKPRFA
jgi:transcriptional regulator with XRE-family HTH domain